jgi:hypothetical protein
MPGKPKVKLKMKTHRPVVSDVFAAVQGKTAIAVHVPIFNSGEYCGTLAALIDFQSISKRFLEQIRVGQTGYAWMMNREGGELFIEVKTVPLEGAFCNRHQVPSGNYCRVSVSDTGAGMDASTRQRVFDPFFTTKQKSRGTGLGLASAYGIIKNHGGLITVDGEVGRGATFHIFLPVSDKQVASEAAMEETLLRGSETILLVDDEDMILEVAKPCWRRWDIVSLWPRGESKPLKWFTPRRTGLI